MLLVNAYVEHSEIAGLGLYAGEPVRLGTAVAIFTHGLQLINEDEYNARTLSGDEAVIKTACRFINHLFLCRESGEIEDEDYVNHSFTPNLLYHCGICFALTDLEPGEELTLNYQFLLSRDEPGFYDTLTGRYVSGLAPTEALYHSSKQLSMLMLSCLADKRSEVIKHPTVRKLKAAKSSTL